MKTLLSLFDGIGVAGLAYRNLFGSNFRYLASEIEPKLVEFTKSELPNIEHLGDVRGLSNLPKIDFMICGSPCQDLSTAGKRQGLLGDRSGLFWEAVRILKEAQPTYWIFENVVSTKENVRLMTEALGVEPVMINSRHFTYQDRKRLYWCNWSVNIPNWDLKQLGHTRVKRTAFNQERIYNYYPTFTRNIRTVAWQYKCGSPVFQDIPWRVYEINQGLPAGYTASLLNTRRRLALANCFTLPVIEYLLNQI